jgi:drug/metabolite transporter (DMT)-like permease
MPRLLTEYGLLFMTAAGLVASQYLIKQGLGDGGALSVTSLPQLGQLIWRVLTTPALLAGYGLSAIVALIWLIILSRLEMSYAVPMMNAIYYILMLAVAAFALHETMTPWRLIGSLFIVVGVVTLAQSS